MSRALVTGGSGILGAAIAKTLAAAGHHIYIHAHGQLERAQALAATIAAEGGTAEAVRFDLTDAVQTEAAIAQILSTGPIQILINNAGIHDDAVMPGMRHDQWSRVIDVSLNGFFNVTQPLLLPMLRTRWGRIVNVSSVAALIGNRGQVNYAAAKGALISATRALALEVATRGVTVNAIAPGIIATSMTESTFDEAAIARLVPMRRAGTGTEVASLIDFLAADGAAYITGQVVSINGGMY